MLKELFARMRKSAPAEPPLRYEEQRRKVADSDPTVRRQVAADPTTRPEILYYLANDAEPSVRREVARNDATPAQADLLLARDLDDEVRSELAHKIARLIPDMPAEERARVRELTVEVLDVLAQDQLPRVRAILAEELKHASQAPHDVILRLARDLHQIVHAPILEYSPLLSDADLLEIIAAGTAHSALQAIAKRRDLSGDVSEAVAATLDVPAVATLLANRSAEVRTATLDRLVEHAEQVEDWHAPLTMRAELSVRAVRRIAGFVAASLVEVLAQRNDLDEATASELATLVQQRLRESNGAVEEADAARAHRLARDGLLDEDVVMAAIEQNDRGFAMHCLAAKSGLPVESVERILRTRNGRLVTALAWRSGLSMRAAMQLQVKLGRVPPPALLHARHGTDFPMTSQEMAWQLQAFA